jgi:hypothetical protein
VKTLNNLGFFNSRCSKVNNFIHKGVLKHNEKWFVGLEIVCRKYHKEKGITLNTNYTYIIKSFQKDKKVKTVCIHDEVDNKYYTIKESMLETHFTLTYCRTTDSSQGRTIKDKITIFDIGLSNYMTRRHIWVAITRVTKLDNVTIFLHNDQEKQFYTQLSIEQYLISKIRGYHRQDQNAGRTIDDDNYIDYEWMMNKLVKSDYKCYYCKCCFEFNINKEDKITSNLSFDRVDSKKSHIKSNCVVACVLCNTSKSNK